MFAVCFSKFIEKKYTYIYIYVDIRYLDSKIDDETYSIGR